MAPALYIARSVQREEDTVLREQRQCSSNDLSLFAGTAFPKGDLQVTSALWKALLKSTLNVQRQESEDSHKYTRPIVLFVSGGGRLGRRERERERSHLFLWMFPHVSEPIKCQLLLGV